ncbi:MAG: zinc-binding dehydrogenase [Verrucomicrobia bacterium]|nr:zinc-binding dehydrogenase [Verrucomicrobiota bacterium]
MRDRPSNDHRKFPIARAGTETGGAKRTLVATIQPPCPDQAAAYGAEGKFVNAAPLGQLLDELAPLFDPGIIQTYLERVFPLAQVVEALQLNESRRARGKIVL